MTVIEAALVLPVLFSLILGMMDAGMLVLNHTQVTAAARDGARAGIIHFQQADGGSGGTLFSPPCSGLTSDQSAICNAIQAHLGTSNFQFSVQCYSQPSLAAGGPKGVILDERLISMVEQVSTTTTVPSTTTTVAPPASGTAETCANAVVDKDQIQVTVRWTRSSWTTVLPASITVTGSSTLTILGLPR